MTKSCRYSVKACICTNFIVLVDSLETDNFYEAQDFILENCHNGYDCLLVDRERGEQLWAYANNLTEESVDCMDAFEEQICGRR